MAKLYDPMAFLGHFTVRVKLMLQTIWKERTDWEQFLSGEIVNNFQLCESEISIKRCRSHSSESITFLKMLARNFLNRWHTFDI